MRSFEDVIVAISVVCRIEPLIAFNSTSKAVVLTRRRCRYDTSTIKATRTYATSAAVRRVRSFAHTLAKRFTEVLKSIPSRRV